MLKSRLRHYCVTTDEAPPRLFWTREGAWRFYTQHRSSGHVFQWHEGDWEWMYGCRDLQDDEIRRLRPQA